MPLTIRRAAFVTAVAAASVGCNRDVTGTAWSAPARPSAPQLAAPVAVVNGRAISAADLAVAMTAAARGRDPHQANSGASAVPARDEILDGLIGEELAAQRATALGLDGDPELQGELARRQAELDSYRRQQLAASLERHARAHVAVGEPELRAFFVENTERIQTVTRISQILLRDRAAIEAARRDLDAGVAFEVVAARQFPAVPVGTRPWELGELKWNQLPEPWTGVVDRLAVGETSPIIEGPRGRLWIVKVLDRRVDPAITFDAARPAIEAVLRDRTARAAYAELERDLRSGATITRARDAGPSHGP